MLEKIKLLNLSTLKTGSKLVNRKMVIWPNKTLAIFLKLQLPFHCDDSFRIRIETKYGEKKGKEGKNEGERLLERGKPSNASKKEV